MVRTMDGGTRASGAKAPRKGTSTPASSTSSGSKANVVSSGGGNPVCHRETPNWQKPITTFFINKDPKKDSDDKEKEAITIENGESSKNYKNRNDEKVKDNKTKVSAEDSDNTSCDEEKPKKKKKLDLSALVDSD